METQGTADFTDGAINGDTDSADIFSFIICAIHIHLRHLWFTVLWLIVINLRFIVIIFNFLNRGMGSEQTGKLPS
jgi:hypothetical protein